jgi:hypothetical protein
MPGSAGCGDPGRRVVPVPGEEDAVEEDEVEEDGLDNGTQSEYKLVRP